ncbi:MAG: DUF427 domain-containing protein, partial [Aeromicrobium sp.]
MSLTRTPGPLATNPPAETNYSIDGPAHRLLLTPFPRRVRAELAGVTVLDTIAGGLVHESNLLPVLYVPEADVDMSLLEPTDRTSHCPFKGDASYWSVRVADRVAENAVWGYRDPIDSAAWLRGLVGFYWDRLDRWFDEDDEVFAHLRDPFHRTDVRPSSRTVTVRIGDAVVAESRHALVLSETGLPNRWYVPVEDIRTELFVPTDTTTHCPYKGDASYWTYRPGDGGDDVVDVAWSYQKPLD